MSRDEVSEPSIAILLSSSIVSKSTTLEKFCRSLLSLACSLCKHKLSFEFSPELVKSSLVYMHSDSDVLQQCCCTPSEHRVHGVCARAAEPSSCPSEGVRSPVVVSLYNINGISPQPTTRPKTQLKIAFSSFAACCHAVRKKAPRHLGGGVEG